MMTRRWTEATAAPKTIAPPSSTRNPSPGSTRSFTIEFLGRRNEAIEIPQKICHELGQAEARVACPSIQAQLTSFSMQSPHSPAASNRQNQSGSSQKRQKMRKARFAATGILPL
jgi:hypothetical protein